MARTTTVKQQDLINDVHRVAKMNHGEVRVSDYIKSGAFSLSTVKRYFGDATNSTFATILNHEENDDVMSRLTMRMLVRKFAKQMGKENIALTHDNFAEFTGLEMKMLTDKFGSFDKAVEVAGFTVGEVVEVTTRKNKKVAA